MTTSKKNSKQLLKKLSKSVEQMFQAKEKLKIDNFTQGSKEAGISIKQVVITSKQIVLRYKANSQTQMTITSNCQDIAVFTSKIIQHGQDYIAKQKTSPPATVKEMDTNLSNLISQLYNSVKKLVDNIKLISNNAA